MNFFHHLFPAYLSSMAACIIGIAAPTSAAFVDGNKLLATCESEHHSDFGDCIGYITGVADVLQKTEINGFTACLPSNVTRGQIRDVVVRDLRSNPANRHYIATGLVAEALYKAFPCKQQPQKSPPQSTNPFR